MGLGVPYFNFVGLIIRILLFWVLLLGSPIVGNSDLATNSRGTVGPGDKIKRIQGLQLHLREMQSRVLEPEVP